MEEHLRRLAGEGKYSPEAFRFLFEALEHALILSGRDRAEGSDRHISGQELLQGIRDYGRHLLGPLALETWRAWGVRTSLDWGKIVFLLVEARMLNRQDSDSLDDFDEEFDYEEYFVRDYRPEIGAELGED